MTKSEAHCKIDISFVKGVMKIFFATGDLPASEI